MTSERQRKSGWLVPSPVDTYDLMMVCLCVPDTRDYRAAFRGALWELAKAWNWAADTPGDYPDQHAAASYWEQLLGEHLHMPCNICELVAACFESILNTPYNDLPDGQKRLLDALRGIMANDDMIQSIINGVGGIVPAATGSNIISDCDNDAVYGFVTQMVDFVDYVVVDMYEIFDAVTNAVGLFAVAAENVPALSNLIELLEWLQDSALTNYNANMTVSLKQEYVCDLFCLARQECSLTWYQVFKYYADRLSASITLDLDGIINIATYIVSGTWSGSQFCDVAYMFFAGVLYYGARWRNNTMQSMILALSAMWNDPNSDWSVLCTECQNLWVAEFDFTSSQCNWIVEPAAAPAGAYNMGIGWTPTISPAASGDDSMRVDIKLLISSAFAVKRVDMTYTDMVKGVWTGSTGDWAMVANLDYSHMHASYAQLIDGDETYSKTRDYNRDTAIWADVRCGRGNPPTGSFVLTTYKIWGEGTPPAEIVANATTFTNL